VIPLLPVLHTSEPGSFARKSFLERYPRIIDDVIATNNYPAKIVFAIQSLRDEVLQGTIQPLREDAPDVAFWNDDARAHLGKSWFDVPWFWAEAFFYRRFLEAVRYFQPGAFYHYDPFAPQKCRELEPGSAPNTLGAVLAHLPPSIPDQFNVLMHSCLWGNRTDLSYLEIISDSKTLKLEHERANLLVDDTARVWEHVRSHRGRIDFICDNAGTELSFDLALADFLLRTNLAEKIVLNVKPQPTFVSDAMIADIHATLDAFSDSEERSLQEIAERLDRAIIAQRLIFTDHSFWVTGFFFHDMPDDLRAPLAQTHLVISKGDANYRRIIGDCRWDTTTPFEKLASHFPSSLVALRTLKSDPIVGLEPGLAERLDALDSQWHVNGKRGIIQFMRK
jgi:uncharacterized protein with ATP-grasp and redox domains